MTSNPVLDVLLAPQTLKCAGQGLLQDQGGNRRSKAALSLQVRILFSKGPFISIFASDPHIIIKAINQNLNSVLRDSNINGHDYMRNIVHLPVFLNSRGLSTAKKLCMAAPTNGDLLAAEGTQKNMADIYEKVKMTYK